MTHGDFEPPPSGDPEGDPDRDRLGCVAFAMFFIALLAVTLAAMFTFLV